MDETRKKSGPKPRHWSYRKKKLSTHLDEWERGMLKDLMQKWNTKYVSETLRKCLREGHRLEYGY